MSQASASESRKVLTVLAPIAVEIFLYSTLGMASPSWQVSQGALFAIIFYMPYLPILRGVIFLIIVTPWKSRLPAKVEGMLKWSLFLAPIVLLVTHSWSYLRDIDRKDLAPMLLAYVVCEFALGYLLLRLSKRWSDL